MTEDVSISRRRFMLTFATAVAAGGAPLSMFRASSAWAADNDSNDVLIQLGKLLCPHDGLDETVYVEVIGQVLAMAAADPASDALVRSAESELDSKRGSSWYSLSEEDQVAVMLESQDQPFFATILGNLRFALYTHKGLWEHVGFPGSSKEHGGYKYRGFDDIDWLPEGE